MPATSNKGYEVQVAGTNSGTWGDLLNTNVITFMDTNLAGLLSTALASSPVTLSASDARNAMQRFTGSLGANVQVTNPCVGFWFAENVTSGAFDVTLTNGAGSPVTLKQNRRATLFADGSNGVRIVSVAPITNPAAVPTGAVMLFMQSAVPSGWTLSTAWNDYGIQLSSVSGGLPGGSTYGVLGHSTVHARTQVDAHALTAAESPKHTHQLTLDCVIVFSGSGSDAGFPYWCGAPVNFGTGVGTSDYTGGGSGHVHGLDLRVLTVTGVIGTRTS